MILLRKKKGQAATEFLMTYGWAILSLGIVIAVLVTVFSWKPADSIADSCTFMDSFTCIDAKLNESGVINMSLKNIVGSQINVTKISCKVDNETVDNTIGVIVASGETFYADCALTKPYFLGEKIRVSASIQFLKEGRSFPATSEANIIATVS